MAAETRDGHQFGARASETRACPAPPLLTIPQAALSLGVAERTLRRILEEPNLHAHLIERTHKVGIYYKFIPLIPPALMAALAARFAPPEPGV